jgi:hypothetical protein
MPWGALASMVIIYMFMGAAYTDGMIESDPSLSLIPLAEGVGGGIFSDIAGILDMMVNLLTFNIVGLPDFFRVPIVAITGTMLIWLALQFIHKVKSTVNPLGG